MDSRFFVPRDEDRLKIPESGESMVKDELSMIPDMSREDAIRVYNDVIEHEASPENYLELGKLLMAAKHLDQIDPENYHLYPADVQQVMLPTVQKQIEFLFRLRHNYNSANSDD